MSAFVNEGGEKKLPRVSERIKQHAQRSQDTLLPIESGYDG
jgi:hypothetical protein